MVLAYLDTLSGIAGDMTLAALVDAGADREYIAAQVGSLGMPGVELQFSETEKHCFRALRLDVKHPPEHAHRHLSGIEAMIDGSRLTEREQSMSRRVFRKLGQSEAKVHGTTLEKVHFHEVGAVDSIVDIIGSVVALCSLDVRRIVAAPPPLGSGTIRIAHGLVSVPAPATAELLRGIPVRQSNIEAELTTPTGAALLACLADQFGTLPNMQISRIGYGAGHRDLKEQANVLRVFLGEALVDYEDEVTLLETNLDDVSGEQLGYALEQLWKLGALDVFTTPIGMKKGRPATMVSVLCQPEVRVAMEESLFKHSGSLGIRRTTMARSKLRRESVSIETEWGSVRVKVAWTPTGDRRLSPEYEDCKRVAEQHQLALDAVYRIVLDHADQLLGSQPTATDTSQMDTSFGDRASEAHGHDHHHGTHDHHDHHHH